MSLPPMSSVEFHLKQAERMRKELGIQIFYDPYFNCYVTDSSNWNELCCIPETKVRWGLEMDNAVDGGYIRVRIRRSATDAGDDSTAAAQLLGYDYKASDDSIRWWYGGEFYSKDLYVHTEAKEDDTSQVDDDWWKWGKYADKSVEEVDRDENNNP